MSGLAHVLGLDDPAGAFYLFWSGSGADLGYLGVIGVGIGWIRRHNCHEPRCHRIARIPIPDSPYVVCHRHHPNPVPSEAVE